MNKYLWSHLNRQEVGAYAKDFVMTELTKLGFQVEHIKIDGRGIDFIARKGDRPPIEVKVKSLRKFGYIFIHKSKFALSEHRYLAFVMLEDGKPPTLSFIASTRWKTPDNVFSSRDYEGKQSLPEWGLSVCESNMESIRASSINLGALI
jgi:hypothetical protein